MAMKPVKMKVGSHRRQRIVEIILDVAEVEKFDHIRTKEGLNTPSQGFRRLLTMYDELQMLKSRIKELE